MQNFMFTSAVNAGGRVFTASHWDEAHRESGIYENGDVIGNCAEAIGEAVAVNDTHVFVGAKNGIKQFTFEGSPPADAATSSRFSRKKKKTPAPARKAAAPRCARRR